MTEPTPLDRRRRAHAVTPYFCEHCDNLHLALKDERGHIYTEAVLSNTMVLDMVLMLVRHNQEMIDDARRT